MSAHPITAGMTDDELRAYYKRTAPAEDVRFFMRAVGEAHPLHWVAAALLDQIVANKGKHSKATRAAYLQLHAEWRGYARTTLPDYQTPSPVAAEAAPAIPAAAAAELDRFQAFAADHAAPTPAPLTAGQKAAATRKARMAAGTLTMDRSAIARKAAATRRARKAA